jgi:BirA family biotin operon repressor/biotin-[acetyl-CoA-carboxylase] ligase
MSPAMVQTVVRREEVGSTSDLARALVEAGGVALPLLVRADRQTRGRGRGANAWWSGPGSLTVTLALDPRAHGLTTAHEPRLALATAVAVVDALGPYSIPDLGIRWPNDVEAGGRKIAGILPERVETPEGVRVLIGVGLNVRTRLDEAPADVRAMAASLADLVGPEREPPEPDRVLDDLLECLAEILPRLAADDPALASRWASLDTLGGRPVRVDTGPRVVSGIGNGIDAEGALLVASQGKVLRLFGGQVLRDV